jgi:Family of unknown function (DUF5985)
MAAIGSLVYFLCLAASAVCAGLLIRGYMRSRTRILLWSAICFVLLALNNLLAVVDIVLIPEGIDLRLERIASSFAAVLVLLYGFIWETD